MKRQNWFVLFTGLALMAGAACALQSLQSWLKLGKPGLKVANESIAGVEHLPGGVEKPFVAGTNMVWLPPKVLDYQSEIIPIDRAVCDLLPKDTTHGQRQYIAADGFHVQNTVVLMGADRTSIHRPDFCLTGSGWKLSPSEVVWIDIDRPERYRLPVNKIFLRGVLKNERGESEERAGVYLYWYVADHAITANNRLLMKSMARQLLLHGETQRWAYVIYFAACAPGQEESAFERMKQLIAAAVPEYQTASGAALESK